jgi:GntR family transcriptional regulator/MocR family aminotransferase
MTYPDMLDYSSSGGYAPLRRAVADYLRVFRSVPLNLEQVIITSGTQESLVLCALLLANQHDAVWLEDPAYWGAVKAFMATGLSLHAVPVDDQGIAPQALDNTVPPRLIYVTPSHQYPTGAVMSLPRRHQLLSLARQHQAWILEDDYDSEFRFSGPPIASLAGLDTDQRVIYLGSFSKVLYPGLKLGYLVVPKGLAAAFKRAHYDLNRPGQMPVQAALAEFIDMGHFASAMRRARQSYAQRRASLLAALQPCLGPLAQITGAEQGLHLCLRLPDTLDDKALTQQLGKLGLTVRPLSGYCLKQTGLRGLIIGYGYAPQADIEHFGPVLARTIANALSRSSASA